MLFPNFNHNGDGKCKTKQGKRRAKTREILLLREQRKRVLKLASSLIRSERAALEVRRVVVAVDDADVDVVVVVVDGIVVVAVIVTANASEE